MEQRQGVRYQGCRRSCELRDMRVDGDDARAPVASGFAAVFDSESDAGGLAWFREVIRPGSFAKTLKEADVRALQNHDANLVLGRTRAKTLRLEERDGGLYFEADFPDTTYARDLAEVMRRGDVTQGSFGFTVIKERWKEEKDQKPLRELLEVSLHDGDISIVTFPWYPETQIEVDARMQLRALIDRAQTGTLDDDSRALLCALYDTLAQLRGEPGDAHSDEEPGEDHSTKAADEEADLHTQAAVARARLAALLTEL